MFGKKSMENSLKKVDIAVLNIICDWNCPDCGKKNEKRKMSNGCRWCKKN